jgi:hypothetical protein
MTALITKHKRETMPNLYYNTALLTSKHKEQQCFDVTEGAGDRESGCMLQLKVLDQHLP